MAKDDGLKQRKGGEEAAATKKDAPKPFKQRGWFPEGGVVDRVDKLVSSFVFTLSLPAPLEVLLSMPGLWFGMPLTGLGICPLVVAALADALNPDAGSPLLPVPFWQATVAPLLALMVAFWIRICHESMFSQWWAEGKKEGGLVRAYMPFGRQSAEHVFMFAPHFCAGVTMVFFGYTGAPHRAACFFVCAWVGVVTVIDSLKHLFSRRRPCVCGYPKKDSHPGAHDALFDQLYQDASKPVIKRHMPQMQWILRSQRTCFTSFPSGDAAGAMAFSTTSALVVSTAGGPDTWLYAIGACAFLAAFGRMFFHAHHLLDVTAGCAISAALILAVHQQLLGGAQPAASWPVMLVLQVVCTLIMRQNRKLSSH